MKRELEKFLSRWPSAILMDRDLYCYFDSAPVQARKDLICRAVSWGWLQRIKRGLYIIGPPFHHEKPSRFELAQHIYGPSYISMESAFSYHQMIPEAVYATVSVCAKKSAEFQTSQGLFLFHHIPAMHFYEGVERAKEGQIVYLIASPLKAMGDYIFVTKKKYISVMEMAEDLRIEEEMLKNQPQDLLDRLIGCYPCERVQQFYRLLK